MPRVYNFSAGPGTLPEEVLLQAADEMLDWRGTGQSVMEMSHRGKEFISIAEEAEADLRKLLEIPEGYHVLFLQGGASLQFEMIPMNLIQGRAVSDYINTGEWAKKAINAAKSLADVNVAASAEDRAFTYVPDQSDWQLTERAAYVHYTANETINGVEFGWVPDVGDVPLVSDMSSNMLSRPVDIRRFGLIYAGAQRTSVRPAALVIVREDLIASVNPRRRRCSTTRPMSRRGPCTTRRPPTRSMSRVWCSSGCWRRAGWSRRSSAMSPRPRCCTTSSTARISMSTLSTKPTGRG